MPDWKSLIDHLDAQGSSSVRIDVEDVDKIVGGDLADGARFGPTKKGLSDYWRTERVLPVLKDGGWTVDFADYPAQVIGFRRLSEIDETTTTSSLAAAIQHLVAQAGRVGTVTSISATKALEDGTSVTLTIDPTAQAKGGNPQARPSVQGKADVSQEQPQTPRVSPEKPIWRLPSQEATRDSIRCDDQSAFHWPVDRSDAGDRQGFRRAVRRCITDIEEAQGLGGYGCLAAMSQKKSSQTKTQAVYSPRALGLRRVRDEHALFDLVVHEKVAIVSISGHSFNRADSIRLEITNRTGLSVHFSVPAHTVFEQEADDPDVQDLLLRNPVKGVLAPSETKSITAFGLCMDQERSAPDGEKLLLTPWILSTEVAKQEELWQATGGGRRRGRKPPSRPA